MSKTAHEVLSELATFLTDPDTNRTERKKVWDVLTALRGPDILSESYYGPGKVKRATTGLVRYAFLLLGKFPVKGIMIGSEDGMFHTLSPEGDMIFEQQKFNETFWHGKLHGSIFNADMQELVEERKKLPPVEKEQGPAWRVYIDKLRRGEVNPLDHFAIHAQRAFRALGLKWDEKNPWAA